MRNCTTWIIVLLLVVLYGTVHARTDVFPQFDFRSDGKLVYDLYLMGDEALPYLIKNITHEEHQVRERAFYFIENYYPDPRALSALTVLFLHENDSWTRIKAANLMAHNRHYNVY